MHRYSLSESTSYANNLFQECSTHITYKNVLKENKSFQLYENVDAYFI